MFNFSNKKNCSILLSLLMALRHYALDWRLTRNEHDSEQTLRFALPLLKMTNRLCKPKSIDFS